MTTFYKRLDDLMNEKGYKIADLVEKSKKYGKGALSKVNFSQWKHDGSTPSSFKLHTLADILQVNPNYLLGYTNEPAYDIEQLTKEQELCDLMKKCYGTDAYKIVKMYMMLNEEGKKAAFERINELTELEKFQVKRASKKAI